MREVEVKFLGSGDAFGSGARLQSCVLVTYDKGRFLIDCGASTMIGMNRYGVDPNSINMIFISHLHGDHCGGIPFLLIASQILHKRSEPLLIAGPPGMKEWISQAMEIFFPGSSKVNRRFPIEVIEFRGRNSKTAGSVTVTPYPSLHHGDSSFSLRIECEGKVIAFSSDTEWTDALCETASGADLFIAEAYFYEKKIKGHMDYKTLAENYPRTSAKRLMLVHMSADMLAMSKKIECDCAEDGLTVHI
ncbi:MAG TPA: MBL fold metallo-hydrolase [Syntrophales bacterium]|nr:MBL fold metallo-hydrolase [Syntrophales bacterium]